MTQATPTTSALMREVHADILVERARQNKKWGLQRHPHAYWHVIAAEEAGEVAQEIQSYQDTGDLQALGRLYVELVQASAVYQAFAEQVLEELRAAEPLKEGEQVT